MAAARFYMGIICSAFVLGSPVSERNMLNENKRAKVVQRAMGEVGTRERTGWNDGERVEIYLRSVGLKRGDPYCAAFVSWVYKMEGFDKPRSGWSPALFPDARLARSALPGNVLGIYFPDKKRVAHVGLIVQQHGDWVTSIEANTNIAGSREGDGVYKKLRHIKTIYSISDWIKEKGEQP